MYSFSNSATASSRRMWPSSIWSISASSLARNFFESLFSASEPPAIAGGHGPLRHPLPQVVLAKRPTDLLRLKVGVLPGIGPWLPRQLARELAERVVACSNPTFPDSP